MTQPDFGFTKETVWTSVSPEYVPSWGVKEALREVLQEAVDVRRRYKAEVRAGWSRGFVTVSDDGPGIPRSALALGRSGKRGDGSLIGQFGEGLKLACLVAARNGRRMSVETVGYSFSPGIARDERLGCDVLVFFIEENTKKKGTRVRVEASEEEFDAARSLFLPDHGKKDRVFSPGGRVYVNGLLVRERPDLLFSYSFWGDLKSLQNRDRSSIDEAALRKKVASALAGAPAEILKVLFREVAGRSPERFEAGLNPYDFPPDAPQRPGAWRRAFAEAFGKKACLSRDPRSDLEAENQGWRVLKLPWGWGRFCEERLKVPTSAAALRGNRRSPRAVPLSGLDADERAVLSWARRLVKRFCADPGKVRVAVPGSLGAFGDSSGSGEKTLGLYSSEKGTVWLDRTVLKDAREALKILLHETLHKRSGAPDATRRFEDAWNDLAADLVLSLTKSRPRLRKEACRIDLRLQDDPR